VDGYLNKPFPTAQLQQLILNILAAQPTPEAEIEHIMAVNK
jgi:hypothetical protein